MDKPPDVLESERKNTELKKFIRVNKQLQKEKKEQHKLETALEKVRSQCMAMQFSNDIQKVANTWLKQLKDMNLDFDVAVIDTPDIKSKANNFWIAVSDRVYDQKIHVPYFDHPIVKSGWEAFDSGKKIFKQRFTKEQKDSYFKHGFLYSDFKYIPESRKQYILEANSYATNWAFGKFSFVALSSFKGKLLPDKQDQILIKFVTAFDQAYTRFLDIKKAEEQAQEAQIEAALERVRSRTMAMQHSEELAQTASIMFEEIENFGTDIWSCGFNIWNKEDKICTSWMSSQGVLLPPMQIPLTENFAFVHFYESRLRGDSLFVDDISGEALKNHYKYMRTLPGIKKVMEVFAKEHLTLPKRQINHLANFAHGNLIFRTLEPCPQLHDIFKRFAKVFEQTYTRFLDLQKAEAQTREALKQASLDRVRGEIASMRTSKDLNRITPVIWHELKSLEVPFFRCGVFIISEEKQKIQAYLTTPEGEALAVLNLAFDENQLTKNTINYWRKKQVYEEHWNKEDFINWTKAMMKLGQVQSAQDYQGSESAPESLNLHFVPFKQGMLYVGDTSPLPDDKIELVKSLAEAFSMAYARYDDFRLLEEAKTNIENTLTKLKSTQTKLIHAEKMASLGALTAGIAHEIQNPLNFVKNFSELNKDMLEELHEEIGNENIPEVKEIARDAIENVEKIIHHAKRAETIVKGMLLHSRGSSGQKELTDINTLCDEYLRLSYHGFRAKDKSFHSGYKLEADESLPKIKVVPQDIGRVLANLINNAFYVVYEKAKSPLTPQGGSEKSKKEYNPQVIVKTSYLPPSGGQTRPDDPVGRGGAVVISVTDNGPGIPDSIKDKIFEPFFTTKPAGQGIGLGLSISYDIVKAHGGDIKIESKMGNGSEFIILLPV